MSRDTDRTDLMTAAENLNDVRVAFDNAGGVIIFSPEYAHSYNDGTQPGEDVKALLAGGNIALWDGNDEELRLALTEEEIDRYERAYTVAEIANLLRAGMVEVDEDDVYVRDGSLRGKNHLSGYSEAQFFRALVSK